MSHTNGKVPPLIMELSSREENSENVYQLAQELIRSLDAASNEHMENISADDKLHENSET